MGDRICVMAGGELQQIGTPLEIYNEPATLFVAGFVGAPPMNFLRGALVEDGGRRLFVNDAVRLPVGGGFATCAPRPEVVLGIRPHQTHLAPAGPGTLPLKVFAIEHLGNETIVVCDGPGGDRFRVIAPPGFAAAIGDRVDAAIDGDRARLYDPATERALDQADGVTA